MKAYKYKFKGDNDDFTVRFHNTGCVTIVDKNGEHEVGMWIRPKDDNHNYKGWLFEAKYPEYAWEQKDLGAYLLSKWYNKKKKKN